MSLEELRQEKFNENTIKANESRYNKTFKINIQNKICEFDTNITTQIDLLTAFAVCSQGEIYKGWICNNGVDIDLTLEDVIQISENFRKLSNVYPQWKEYQYAIKDAKTEEELENIQIEYEV